MNCLRLLLSAAVLAACAVPSPAALVIDDAFGEATEPVLNRQGTPSPMIAGVFPKGWMEDASGWAKVSAECVPGQQDGIRYLRIVTKTIQGRGRVDFCRLLPPVTEATCYRLRVRSRAWNWSGPNPVLGVRHLHPPWDFVWSTALSASSNWSETDVRFELKPDAADAAFFLSTECAGGSLDVASIQLEQIPEARLRAEADAAYPDHGPANLFRDSRFPLGMPGGWFIKREVSDLEGPAPVAGDPAFGGTWGNGTIRVEADPASPGPTGSPSLRIASVDGRGVTVSSEPFLPVYPFVRHAVTFSAKGEGTWMCRVLADGDGNGAVDGLSAGQGVSNQVVAQFSFTPPAAWGRIAIPFVPHLLAEGYRLEFRGKGTLWIDGLQAGPEEKSGTYASAGACEAALGLPKSDASAARIQFSDEPARVAWCVTGQAAGARLRLRVADLYGGVTALPDVALEPGKMGTVQSADFSAALAGHPYGQFRIEAWVEAKAGEKPVSPPAELVVNRLPRPRYWGKDAPDSPFGVHVAAVSRNVLLAKAAGVNWVRIHDLPYTAWNFLEPEKGQWHFYDGEIALYRKMGMKVLGQVASAPKWASYYADSGKTTWCNWDMWFEPKDLADYARYVTTVVARYKGVIDDWDVWNEPWTFPFWAKGYDLAKPNGVEGYRPSPQAAADYAALMQSAYRAAHAANPGCNVLGFNTTGHAEPDLYRFSGPEWTGGVLAAGGLSACDTLCYHSYDSRALGYPGDVVASALDAASAPLRKAGDGRLPKPVWMTEGSSVSNMSIGFGLARLTAFGPPVDDADRISDRTARYMLSLASQGVSRWFLYAMSQYTGRITPTYAVLVTPDGYLHPSGVAHAAFARLVEGARFVRVHEAAPGIYAYLFREGDRAVVAVSSREPDAAFRLPAMKGADAADLYGNPLPPGAAFQGKVAYLSAKGEAADRLEAALAPGT